MVTPAAITADLEGLAMEHTSRGPLAVTEYMESLACDSAFATASPTGLDAECWSDVRNLI